MLYRFIVAIIGFAIVVGAPTAHAVKAESAGLAISPVRDEITLAAGQVARDALTVTNRTDRERPVRIEIQSFSVTNHTYDYRFKPIEYDWVKLGYTKLPLEPHQKASVSYSVTVPQDAASGGYYFVLIASTSMTERGVTSTVQAAMPLYVTVDGGDVRRSSVMENAKVPFIVMGDKIPYSYDVKNTGNVHMNATFTARLDDFWGNQAEASEVHAVFPDTVRSIGGSLQAPLLPGVYRLTYGYVADPSRGVTMHEAYIINAPPWSLVAGGLLLFGIVSVWRHAIRQRDATGER